MNLRPFLVLTITSYLAAPGFLLVNTAQSGPVGPSLASLPAKPFANIQTTGHQRLQPMAAEQGLYFRENRGQVTDQYGRPRPDVLFSGEQEGLIFHLKADGIHYQLNQSSNDTSSIYRIDIRWTNANPHPTIETVDALPDEENFYNLPASQNPVLGVKRFKSIIYKNIYPHTDLHWYIGDHGLEYDFIVQPGGDPGKIGIEIKGAALVVDGQQSLVMKTPLGQVKEGSLKVYQGSTNIAARWVVAGQKAGFEITGRFDKNLPLRIDPPVRQWGTYYGGTRRDEIHALAAFGTNAVYAAGWTQSDGAGIIATTGAHQVTRGSSSTGSSGRDAMLIKFDGNGVRQWATYYGGNQEDQAFGLATDADGNVYMAGRTLSGGGIATAGSHKSGTFSNDAFLVKFNASGQRIWGTYYGSQFQPEDGVSCATDGSGNVYLAGNATGSTEGVATTGAHQETIAAQTDAFVVKFNSSGVRQWGTFYGGAGNDFATGCTTDANGNVFLCGYSTSATGIATAGSHQPTQGSAANDGFLVKLNTNGTRQWATYYGGAEVDWAYACRADTEGNIYLAGTTQSTVNIGTAGSHQATKAGNNLDGDAYLSKFDGNGARLWATYYGGAGADAGLALAVNANGDVMMAGGSNSPLGIATGDGHQTAVGGNGLPTDGYLVLFNGSGVRQWGTYYGGSFDDNSSALTFDGAGNLLMAGRTLSVGSELATAGAHQGSYNGDNNSASSALYDGFVVKFSLAASQPGYSFTGTGAWSNPANWQGGVVPPATIPSGVTITINPAGDGECVLDIAVSLAAGATLNVFPGKKLNVNGNLTLE